MAEGALFGNDFWPRVPAHAMGRLSVGKLQSLNPPQPADPTLLWELCFYYDERDGIAQKFVRYTVFTENEIATPEGRSARLLHRGSETPGTGVRLAYGQVAGVAQGPHEDPPVGALSR